MIRHDFYCGKCKTWIEVSFGSYADFVKEYECECGGTAVQAWRKAPGLAGVEEPSTRGVRRTFNAGLDVQTGKYFHTRSDRDRYVRSRGFEMLGPEEHQRMLKSYRPKEDISTAGLETAMQKSWEELKAGKPAPPMGRVDLRETNVVGGK